MKVKIIRPTVAQHRQVMPGEELDVTKQEAVQLIGANKAVAVKDVAVETTDKPLAEVEQAVSVEPEGSMQKADVTPKRGKAKSPKSGDQKASE